MKTMTLVNDLTCGKKKFLKKIKKKNSKKIKKN